MTATTIRLECPRCGAAVRVLPSASATWSCGIADPGEGHSYLKGRLAPTKMTTTPTTWNNP